LPETQIAHPRSEEQRLKAIDVAAQSFEKISKFFGDFASIVKPYVQMHQRMPWL
jgi:hypothetical protein